MRILIITNHLNGTDGWSRYAHDLAVSLSGRGHKVVCAVAEESDRVKIEQKCILPPPALARISLQKVYNIAKEINILQKEFSFDVIHVAVETYTLALPLARIDDTIPIIVSLHGTFSYLPKLAKSKFQRLYFFILSGLAARKTTYFVVGSTFTQKRLRAIMPVSYFRKIEKKIRLIKYGALIPSPKKTRFISNKKKQILFVGAIKRRKGLLETLKALRFYKEEYGGDFKFSIVGNYVSDDKYFQSLCRFIQKERLEQQISFLGRMSDEKLSQLYDQVDLYLMLPVDDGSAFEGFGLVYIEANARGIPTIGSYASGAEDAIKDGFSGYLVDPYGILAVANRIDRVLNSSSIKRNDCLDWAREHDINRRIVEYEVLYGHTK
ncbi:MAG: glycosyltransferase family 4 protein [bacterium]|nr:glycosyltransferase family 4 protein [bacterium]